MSKFHYDYIQLAPIPPKLHSPTYIPPLIFLHGKLNCSFIYIFRLDMVDDLKGCQVDKSAKIGH